MKVDFQSILQGRLSKQLRVYAAATQQIEAIEAADSLRLQYQIQSEAFYALQLLAYYHYKQFFGTKKIHRIPHETGHASVGFRKLKPTLTKPTLLSWAQLAPRLHQIDPALVIQRPDTPAIVALDPQDSRYTAVRQLGIQTTQDETFFVDLL